MLAPDLRRLRPPLAWREGMLAAAAILLAGALSAAAQTPSPSPPPAAAQVQPLPPAPAEPAAPPRREGFLDALGRWMEKSAADFKASVEENNAKWRELNEKNEKAAREAAAASREAIEAFKNLSNVRIVEAKRTCEPAPNGSPDCQAAAEAICRDKGFAGGKSADIQTSRKCSARALLTRDEGGCRIETMVVKAACQ